MIEGRELGVPRRSPETYRESSPRCASMDAGLSISLIFESFIAFNILV
jgi:hypothetical protein